MAVTCLLILSRFIMDSVGDPNSLVSDCCSERLILNDSCPADQRCSAGCFQVWTNNGSLSCLQCTNETGWEASLNRTACRDVTTRASEIPMNISTTPYVPHHLTSILQPSEMASMIPELNTSGRKPRYVRRERTHQSAPVLLDPSADTRVSHV
ncbi:uncharacterized protein C1orf159 homolog isoform 4-T5 [Anomaloglossus baeobatrachus]|uniref:uncharacterized protein C1orf159 homolog isoform X4 n=1 Tax=Anomaloglossus baeobatrachus TaxID=238106 RepID=UPI003F50553B